MISQVLETPNSEKGNRRETALLNCLYFVDKRFINHSHYKLRNMFVQFQMHVISDKLTALECSYGAAFTATEQL